MGNFWEHIREGHVLGEAVTGLERHDCNCWIKSVVVEEKRRRCVLKEEIIVLQIREKDQPSDPPQGARAALIFPERPAANGKRHICAITHIGPSGSPL